MEQERRKRIAIIIVVTVLLIVSVLFLYHFNGDSLNMKDREVILVVTDYMDGNVHEYQIDSFPADTLVMVDHLSNDEKAVLKVGDVVSFNHDGRTKQLRIIGIDFDTGIAALKGDNVTSAITVSLDDINGVVVGTSHVLGVIVNVLKSNAAVFIVIILACAVAVVLIKSHRQQ